MTDNSEEMVSVVIPTYCRADKLAMAIESAIDQGQIIGEIIVVDDNVDERQQVLVEEIVLRYKYSGKVFYIKNEGRHGGSAARNKGIENASYGYVAFLDDDDQWLPNKIILQIQAIERDKSIGAFCGYIENDLVFSEMSYVKPESDVVTLNGFIEGHCPSSTSLAVVKTQVLRDVGGFDIDLVSFEDYDLWMKCAVYGPFSVVRECLALYVQHRGSRLSVDFDKRILGFYELKRKWSHHVEVSNILNKTERYHRSTACIANAKSSLGRSYINSVLWSLASVFEMPWNKRGWVWVFMSLIGFSLARLVRRELRKKT